MERVQRAASRAISGVVRSTLADVVLREAGLETLGEIAEGTALAQYERWRALDPGDVRRHLPWWWCGGFRWRREVERLSLPAERYCSSFTAEAAALLADVRWPGEREGWITAALITDSMSLLQALQGRGGGCKLEDIRRERWNLYVNGKQLGLAWVPGHCGLPDPGNETADEMARRGSELAQERVGVDLATRMAVARTGSRRSRRTTVSRRSMLVA